ncbi:MAG: mechanosensitive ion channel [Oscillospiraceae bacterium]|nr:mechanosensitive ion channel [Oscillospiraceae bacterium]
MKLSFFEKLSDIKLGSISLSTILSAVLIFVICVVFIKLIMRIIGKILGKTHMEKGMRGFVYTMIKVGLWLIAIITIAGCLGIPTASLVAVLSVVGLALSLSVQGIISNIFSGMTLLATKPFVADDYIEVNGLAGTVTSVSLFYTTIRTIDNKLIHIPNSEAASSKVINFTHERFRRIAFSFCASYDAPTDKVKAALLSAAESVDKVLDNPAPFAGINAYKNSTIEYALHVWCLASDYWPAYFAVNEAVREQFAAYNIEFSYDHMNVHIINPEE